MTETVPRVKYCTDFPGAPACCDSCHEDWAMGYEMIEMYTDWGDAVDAVVCCRVCEYVESSDPYPREEL